MSLRLTFRVAAPSIIISLLLLIVGGLGGFYVLRLQRHTADLVALDMATMRSVQQLLLSVTEVRSELAEFLATGSRVHLANIPVKLEQTDTWLRKTESLVDDKDEIALTRRIRDGFQRFSAEYKAASPTNRDTRKIVEQLNNDLAVNALMRPAQELLAREEDLCRKSGDYNLGLASRIIMVLCLLAACGAAAGVVAGVGIARSVSRSIVELYMPVRVASGKLEEVVGPIDMVPSSGIETLDVHLHQLADQVGVVVDRLQQSQLEVLRAEQMAALGHLAAGLAHELRNPLTAMKVLIQKAMQCGKKYAKETKGTFADGLTERDLAVLETETVRLERTIQTFLDFARPPSLEKHPENIRHTIQQTLELLRSRAAQQQVRFLCDFGEQPLLVEADHEQLRQVFVNILCNALDILPQGGVVRISAEMEQTAAPRNGVKRCRGESEISWIKVAIADDGPGISKDLGDRIFEPYVSTKDTGVGLGLAICRRIVESHGGEITAKTRPEGGTLFTIRLPEKDAPRSAHETSD